MKSTSGVRAVHVTHDLIARVRDFVDLRDPQVGVFIYDASCALTDAKVHDNSEGLGATSMSADLLELALFHHFRNKLPPGARSPDWNGGPDPDDSAESTLHRLAAQR